MSPPPIRRASRAPGGSVTARGRRGSPRAGPRARRLDEVEDLLEAAAAAVVGVRHVEVALRRHSPGSNSRSSRILPSAVIVRKRPQVTQVGAVHREDQVEVLEVLRAHLARLRRRARHPCPGRPRWRARPARCRRARRPSRPSRARPRPACRPRVDDVAHHALGRRRAADVAEADEQQPNRLTASEAAHREANATPTPLPAPARRGTPPAGPPRGRPASSVSCPPSVSRAAFSCA